MSQSEGDPMTTVRESIDRIRDGDDPVAVAGELANVYAGNVECYGEEGVLDPDVVTLLIDEADCTDGRTRAHLLAVARQSLKMTFWCDRQTSEADTQVRRLLQYANDSDWRVRQAVLLPGFCHEVIEAAFENPDRWRDLGVELVTTLVARLDDPVDLVRKRAGGLLVGDHRESGYVGTTYDHDILDHAAEYYLWHPTPGEAVPQLIAALEQPVVSIGKEQHPASTVGAVVLALSEREPAIVRGHESRLRELVTADDMYVRTVVIDALERVVDGTDGSLVPLLDGAMPILHHDEPMLQVRGAELVDRLDAALTTAADSVSVSWDERVFADACLATLELSSDSSTRREGYSILERWSPRFADETASHVLDEIQTTVFRSEDPDQYVGTLGCLLALCRRRTPQDATLDIIKLLATEDPDHAYETFERLGGASAFPEDVSRIIEGT
jgi:hypothetical protein